MRLIAGMSFQFQCGAIGSRVVFPYFNFVASFNSSVVRLVVAEWLEYILDFPVSIPVWCDW